jgi:hypothetical protein
VSDLISWTIAPCWVNGSFKSLPWSLLSNRWSSENTKKWKVQLGREKLSATTIDRCYNCRKRKERYVHTEKVKLPWNKKDSFLSGCCSWMSTTKTCKRKFVISWTKIRLGFSAFIGLCYLLFVLMNGARI